MNISVSFSYGINNTLTKSYTAPKTIGEALQQDRTIKAGLGLPERITALVNGRPVEMSHQLTNGMTVVFEQQAASKA